MAKLAKAALQQANELASVERKIKLSLLKHLAVIKNAAVRYGTDINIRSTDLQKLSDDLLVAQVTAHLFGRRRAQAQAKKRLSRKRAMQLDVVGDVISLFKTANEEDVQQLMSQYAEPTQKVMQNLTTKLSQQLRDALAEAVESNVSISAAVDSFFTKQGLDGGKPYYIETLLRTQTQLAYGAARWEEYKNPIIDEILWGYEYSTVGDDRVRENHAALDGVALPKDDPFWQNFFPPNGYNCRCQAIPIFEGDDIPRKNAPKDAYTDAGFDFNPSALVKQAPGAGGVGAKPKPPEPPKTPVVQRILSAFEVLQTQGHEDAINEVREQGIAEGKEFSVLIDEDGNRVGSRIEGSEGAVDLGSEALKPGANLTTVHNHPDNYSLSPEDLKVFRSYPGIRTVSAVGHDNSRYSAIIKGDRLKLYEAVEAEERRIKESVFEKIEALQDLSPTGQLTAEQKAEIKKLRLGLRIGIARTMEELGYVDLIVKRP